MHRPQKHRRRKLAHFIQRMVLKCSFIFGLLPFKYNKISGSLRASKPALIYSILLNSCIFIWVVKHWPDMSSFEFFADKPFNFMLEYATTSGCAIVYMIVLLRTWIGRKHLLRLYMEIASLSKLCFTKDFIRDFECETNDNRIIFKFCVLLFENVMFNILMAYVSFKNDGHYFFILFLITLLLNELNWVECQFFYNILLLHHIIAAINRQLRTYYKQCVRQQVQQSELGASDLNEILGIYIRLTQLATNITTAYEYQICALLFLKLSVAVQGYFYICIIIGSKDLLLGLVDILYYIQMSTTKFIDCWLIMTACQMVINAQEQTTYELRIFNKLELDMEMNRDLHTFSTFCAIQRFRFPLCGLIEINFFAARKLYTSMMTALIWLLQYDLSSYI